MTTSQPAPELTVAEVLEKAAEKLSKPGAWTQRAFARDHSYGNEVSPISDRAVCYCALGAIQAVYGVETAYNPASVFLLKCISGCMISLWNDEDDRNQAEVVAALRAAATKARSEGGGGK